MNIFHSAEDAVAFVKETTIVGPSFELNIADELTFQGRPDAIGAGMAMCSMRFSLKVMNRTDPNFATDIENFDTGYLAKHSHASHRVHFPPRVGGISS
jgi:hypothetical protein